MSSKSIQIRMKDGETMLLAEYVQHERGWEARGRVDEVTSVLEVPGQVVLITYVTVYLGPQLDLCYSLGSLNGVKV
jgi:hypothetical protein